MDVEAQSFSSAVLLATNSLYDMSGQFRKTQKLSNREFGTALAQEMAALGSQTATTTKLVMRATDWPTGSLGPREQQQKFELGEELEKLLHKVREFQSSVTSKLKQQQANNSNQGALASAPSRNNTETTPLLYQQQQQTQVLEHLDQTTLDIHSTVVADRDAEILEIQRGTHEINSIFQDLGVLVAEQGQQLDNVEDNIADLARNTENAGRQLVKAENHQKSRGKWTCIALLLLLVITILVALSVIS